jgi:hypothetical protein
VFTINDAPWCEPCGNAVIDETKPLWIPAIVIAVVGLGVVLAATFGGVRGIGFRLPWQLGLVAGSAVLALAAKFVWRTPLDAPRILPRKPGDPLPRKAPRA